MKTSISKKKKQIKKLITFAIVVIILAVIAFIPTIYRKSHSNKSLYSLLDKYGYSYTATNEGAFAYCKECDYVGVEARVAKNSLCPNCKTNSKTVMLECSDWITYLFSKTTEITDENGNVTTKTETGIAYQFSKSAANKGYTYVEGQHGDASLLRGGNYVFVLVGEPSEELATIINKL